MITLALAGLATLPAVFNRLALGILLDGVRIGDIHVTVHMDHGINPKSGRYATQRIELYDGDPPLPKDAPPDAPPPRPSYRNKGHGLAALAALAKFLKLPLVSAPRHRARALDLDAAGKWGRPLPAEQPPEGGRLWGSKRLLKLCDKEGMILHEGVLYPPTEPLIDAPAPARRVAAPAPDHDGPADPLSDDTDTDDDTDTGFQIEEVEGADADGPAPEDF